MKKILPLLLFLLVALPAHAQANLDQLTRLGDINAYAFSPDGENIYFTRPARVIELSSTRAQTINNLYRASIADQAVVQLASNANFFAVAPNGQKIAYLEFQDATHTRLRTLDLSTGKISDAGPADWGIAPMWTQDSTRVVFSRGQRATLKSEISSQTLSEQPLTRAFVSSPRGDRIAYSADDGLHFVDARSDAVVFGAKDNARIGAMVWDHAGARLVFVAVGPDLAPELWITDGTTNTRVIRAEREYFAEPAWAWDDAQILFTRAPTGSSIISESEIYRVDVAAARVERLTRDHSENSAPQFSPDGTHIAFLRDGDLWLGDATTLSSPEFPRVPSLRLPTSNLQPPGIIRVIHRAANYYRNVPAGQIDTFDFETYVKQVVPYEVYDSWLADALQTQAVAARSYAWFWVLQHTSQSWDVSDWTDYQVMGPKTFPNSANAVEATRGEYLNYKGNLVFAMYSANNGDPTTTNSWGNPYLISVDDPVDFGDAVYGHGLGMSQWGAYKWAANFGWNYQQILLHYYSNVTLEAPASSLPDTKPPIGAITAPWSNWGVVSNHVFLSANASDGASGVASVDFDATYSTGSAVVTQNLAHLTNNYQTVWDLTNIPDQAGIVVTPTIRDNAGNPLTNGYGVAGNIFAGNGIVFNLDRVAPTGTLSAPAWTTVPTITLTLNSADATQMVFSNDWVWEGENQSVQDSSGTVVNDSAALNGRALFGQVSVNPAGVWYGPYTIVLPYGGKYRAYFRLKTDSVTTPAEVALLDVVDNPISRNLSGVVDNGGTTLLGLKRVRGTDFANANVYQEIGVDFWYNSAQTSGLEFRVNYRAAANLWLDRILVTSYPTAYAPSATWVLPSGTGTRIVRAKFLDDSGNISSDAVATIQLGNATQTLSLASGWNLVAFDLQTSLSAQGVLDQVNAQGGNGQEIDAWQNGTWVAHFNNLAFNNFAVENGRGYFIRAGKSSRVSFSGAPITQPMSVTLNAGWNLIAIQGSGTTYTAQTLLDAINAQGGACDQVARWSMGSWVTHLGGLPFNDFALAPDAGYFVRCAGNARFAP